MSGDVNMKTQFAEPASPSAVAGSPRADTPSNVEMQTPDRRTRVSESVSPRKSTLQRKTPAHDTLEKIRGRGISKSVGGYTSPELRHLGSGSQRSMLSIWDASWEGDMEGLIGILQFGHDDKPKSAMKSSSRITDDKEGEDEEEPKWEPSSDWNRTRKVDCGYHRNYNRDYKAKMKLRKEKPKFGDRLDSAMYSPHNNGVDINKFGYLQEFCEGLVFINTQPCKGIHLKPFPDFRTTGIRLHSATPLMFAVASLKLPAVKFLLEKKANIRQKLTQEGDSTISIWEIAYMSSFWVTSREQRAAAKEIKDLMIQYPSQKDNEETDSKKCGPLRLDSDQVHRWMAKFKVVNRESSHFPGWSLREWVYHHKLTGRILYRWGSQEWAAAGIKKVKDLEKLFLMISELHTYSKVSLLKLPPKDATKQPVAGDGEGKDDDNDQQDKPEDSNELQTETQEEPNQESEQQEEDQTYPEDKIEITEEEDPTALFLKSARLTICGLAEIFKTTPQCSKELNPEGFYELHEFISSTELTLNPTGKSLVPMKSLESWDELKTTPEALVLYRPSLSQQKIMHFFFIICDSASGEFTLSDPCGYYPEEPKVYSDQQSVFKDFPRSQFSYHIVVTS